jgi:hypothetical protein
MWCFFSPSLTMPTCRRKRLPNNRSKSDEKKNNIYNNEQRDDTTEKCNSGETGGNQWHYNPYLTHAVGQK